MLIATINLSTPRKLVRSTIDDYLLDLRLQGYDVDKILKTSLRVGIGLAVILLNPCQTKAEGVIKLIPLEDVGYTSNVLKNTRTVYHVFQLHAFRFPTMIQFTLETLLFYVK